MFFIFKMQVYKDLKGLAMSWILYLVWPLSRK